MRFKRFIIWPLKTVGEQPHDATTSETSPTQLFTILSNEKGRLWKVECTPGQDGNNSKYHYPSALLLSLGIL